MAAASMIEAYGNYPIANTFASNEMDDIPAPTISAGSKRVNGDSSEKKHAACDECRKRKLKCSGEHSGCTRCVKNNLTCVFSVQKQMGRPKKRQKLNESPKEPEQSASNSQSAIDPSLSSADLERTDFQNICNAPMAQTVRRSGPAMGSVSHSTMSNTPPSEHPHTPSDSDFYNIAYPTDYSQWPDFSDTTLPMPLVDSFEKDQVASSSNLTPSHPPDSDFNPDSMSSLPSVPECPCLPNLYLTLSTLSTLSAFPISSHAIATLDNAHRTARSVIYCPTCPQKFQTGSQNVMLSSTLITVLVDQWKRISKAPATDIRSGFCPNPPPPGPPSEMSGREDLEWRTFAYDLMRHFVFGDRVLPRLPYQPIEKAHTYLAASSTSLNQRITLTFLADAMERRQRVWHGLEPDIGEFPKKMTRHLEAGHSGFTLEDIKEMEAAHRDGPDNGHLCISLTKHAKRCIGSLDRDVPRLGDGIAHYHS